MGYVRRNFLVPVPSFESFDALNAYLEVWPESHWPGFALRAIQRKRDG